MFWRSGLSFAAVLFCSYANAFYCADLTSQSPYTYVYSGFIAGDSASGTFNHCTDQTDFLVVTASDYENYFPILNYLHANDLVSVTSLEELQASPSGEFPELDQIATAFGAGFVIGLPVFGVVFGARQLFKLMR